MNIAQYKALSRSLRLSGKQKNNVNPVCAVTCSTICQVSAFCGRCLKHTDHDSCTCAFVNRTYATTSPPPLSFPPNPCRTPQQLLSYQQLAYLSTGVPPCPAVNATRTWPCGAKTACSSSRPSGLLREYVSLQASKKSRRSFRCSFKRFLPLKQCHLRTCKQSVRFPYLLDAGN